MHCTNSDIRWSHTQSAVLFLFPLVWNWQSRQAENIWFVFGKLHLQLVVRRTNYGYQSQNCASLLKKLWIIHNTQILFWRSSRGNHDNITDLNTFYKTEFNGSSFYCCFIFFWTVSVLRLFQSAVYFHLFHLIKTPACRLELTLGLERTVISHHCSSIEMFRPLLPERYLSQSPWLT